MANILFFIGKYPSYGGTEKITTVLTNTFVKNGHLVSIASFEQPHLELMSQLDKSVNLLSLSYPVLKRKNLLLLREHIRNKDIHIIINQWCLPFYTNFLCNQARKSTNCKLISALHGVPDQNKKLLTILDKSKKGKTKLTRGLYRLAHKLLLKFTSWNLKYVYARSDSYIVLSKSFVDSFQNLSGLKELTKLKVITNPLTIAEQPRLSNFLKKKENVLLYVGRMDYQNKRVHRIVEVWESIFNDYPDWNLNLVGDGSDKKNLENYVKEKNIDRVVFSGFQKHEPIEFYQKAKIILLTSELEGFGLVVIEGMSYGTIPIVYGSYSAIYDIIENGINGFITPIPYQKSNTIKALEKLMNSEELILEMGKQARQTTLRFSLNKILNQWEGLFNELKD